MAWAFLNFLFPVVTVPELFCQEPLGKAHYHVRSYPDVVLILPVQ